MSIRKALVDSVSVGPVKDGGAQARFVNVKFAESDDVRPIDLLLSGGEDSCPQKGDTVFLMESGETRKSVVAVRDPITPTANPGEKEFYSYTAAGAKLARHKLKANGKQFFSGNSQDLGSQLSALLTALGNLTTALTTFTTGLNAGTLTAQAATCAGALPAISTSLTNVQTALGQLLDTTP